MCQIWASSMFGVAVAFLLAGGNLSAEQDVAQRIDALILAKSKGQKVSQPADDAEFFRHVWLDFDGGIPKVDEAWAFFTKKTPNKRERLIEKLIVAPRFAERMAEAFHVMFMERRGDNDVWKAWHRRCFYHEQAGGCDGAGDSST